MTPQELLGAAREVTHQGPDPTWLRTAAHLARQSLELALRQHIIQFGEIPDDLPFEAQLLALQGTVPDRRLAQDANFTWAALSEACHHHAYELPPMQAELLRWFETVDRLIQATGAQAPS